MADILRMPSLSPTMEEGTIEAWSKAVGDYVDSGDILANIETDKAIVEYEVISEGYLRHLFVEAGSKIPVGKPIAIFSEEADEDIAALIEEGNADLAAGEEFPEAATPAQETVAAQTTSAPEPASPAQNAPAMEAHDLDYDVAVVGAGPGGYVAAIRAAQLGLKTVIIDKQWLGGVCLNVGCIPSKALLKNAELVHTIQHRAEEFGIAFKELEVDFGAAVRRSRSTSERLTQGIAYLMKKNNVDVRMGYARFTGPHSLEVAADQEEAQTLTAKNIIIATGAHARPIPGVEIDGQQVQTYQEAIVQEERPESVIIIGSGAIGVEFATVWNAYGTDVTIVEMLPRIVPLEEPEISKELQKDFNKRGIKTLVNTKVESVNRTKDGVEVAIQQGDKTEVIRASQVLVAIGFVPNVEGIGLEAIGVATERGAIPVNDVMQTNVPHIYAIGDVTAKLMLAHVGSAMGVIAAEHIAGHATQPLQYPMMPRATYCHPQIASFGFTEEQAKEQGLEVKVAQFPFSANGKALGLGEGHGFIKIITDAQYGELLGAHMIGPEVTELLPEFTLAQNTELTIEDIAHNVHAHPTLSEAIMEAAHGLTGGYIHI